MRTDNRTLRRNGMVGRLVLFALCLTVLLLLKTAADVLAQNDAEKPPATPTPAANDAPTSATAKTEDDAGYKQPKTLTEFIQAGGRMMWIILGCSFVVVAVVLERAVSLRRSKALDDDCYDTLLRHLKDKDRELALLQAKNNPTPMARVLTCVIECADSPRAEIEAVIENSGARALWSLQGNGKLLGIISNIAPLLGLLGTVIGIIQAFGKVASHEGAIGNPRMLAEGINYALITTAAGLSVAIPAYLFYHYFRGKAESLVQEIEEKALTLMGDIIASRRNGDDKTEVM